MKKAKQAKEQETKVELELEAPEVKTFVEKVDQKELAKKLDREVAQQEVVVEAKPAVSASSLAPLPGTVPPPVYEAVRSVSRYNKDQT